MRWFRFPILLLVSIAAAFAADFPVKVVDPHGNAVAGARVALYRQGTTNPLDVRTTSGDGHVVFPLESLHLDKTASVRIQVLAPGFAAAWLDSPTSSTPPVLITLRIAPASESVIVTATRSPALGEQTASNVSLLTSDDLTAMSPVALADALRVLPGAVVNVAGERGGLGSVFVEGGNSTYNKVLVDGVPVTDPGGTFNVSTTPLAETDRVEVLRGAQSTLYGSDAMTSVIQVFARTGRAEMPEFRLAADGGNFGTAHGFASLSGARSRFDYDLFADQFNTNGQGPNADYTNALQGGNLGLQLHPRILLRIRARHSNSRTGVPGEWDFNNQRVYSPDLFQWARANNSLGSTELTIAAPSHWQHRLTGYDYNTRRLNEDDSSSTGCFTPPFICPFVSTAHLNRAGFMYQGDYTPQPWLQTTVGYEFEDEIGKIFSSSLGVNSYSAATRLNHSAYIQQRVTWKRVTAIGGVRYVREEADGRTWSPPAPAAASVPAPGIDKAVPRVALSLLAFKGGDSFSGTRLRFSFAQGIKEARFEEEYAGPPYSVSNAKLQPERSRAFEAGVEQRFFGDRLALSANYFNNLFHDLISYVTVDPVNFIGQYQNVDRAMAQGAEFTLTHRVSSHLTWTGSYTFTSSEYLTGSTAGQLLLRRPKHMGTLLATYSRRKWAANISGSFVGRRNDSDFLGLGIDHAAGYALVNLGGWYAINSHITAYANLDNALNRHYNEVVGYPALTANFRAGFRFRIGGGR